MIYIDIKYYILNPQTLNIKRKLSWRKLWIKKSDHLQEYYYGIIGKYNIIDESINYYIAMIETAIYYLKEYDDYYDYVYVQHKIILNDNYFNDSYLVEDIKERDFAEYLKYIFFNDIYNIDDVYNMIIKGKEKFNYDLIISRLLYPSYYLFYLEKIFLNGKIEDELVNIINKTFEYEQYLKLIVNKINEFRVKKIVLPF